MPSSNSSPERQKKQHPMHLPRNIRAMTDDDKHDPKSDRGRTIVLCLDGTGDKFDKDNSNIVSLVAALKKDDPKQVTYYQAGIGTYGEGGLSGGFSAMADMAVGSGLGLHVRDAYHFLMHTYKEGDKICLFGFSRGAYTARCLAGMVHKVGLLPPRNIAQIPFAYEFYKDNSTEGWRDSFEFKKTFCIDVNIYYIGVFDSVSSVGIIPRQLPLSSTPFNKPRFFRHAIALDERRAKFKPCRHEDKDWKDIEDVVASADANEVDTSSLMSGHSHTDSNSSQLGKHLEPLKKIHDDEEEFAPHPQAFKSNVDEVFFLGCHADVGGGAEKNETRHKLANVPLRWMIRSTFQCNTGIIWSTRRLAELGMDVHTLWPKYTTLDVPSLLEPDPEIVAKYEEGLPPMRARGAKLRPVHRRHKGEGLYQLHLTEREEEEALANLRKHEWLDEQMEDYFDALAPINDELERTKGWWILEYWPVQYKMQKAESDEWEVRTGMNLGRYRGIEDIEPQLHWTAKHRAEKLGYINRARIGRQAKWKLVA